MKCVHCGKKAACIGTYEGNHCPIEPACNECCGHGNEDGKCVYLRDTADVVEWLNREVEWRVELETEADSLRALVREMLWEVTHLHEYSGCADENCQAKKVIARAEEATKPCQ